MKVDLDKATLDLDRLQIMKLRGARGVRVICRAGMLWITQEGVARDDFLGPGGSFEVETDRTVLIEALSPSSATVDSSNSARGSASARMEVGSV